MSDARAADARTQEFSRRKQPLSGELMDPADVAHAAVFLLSDESRVVTGQVLLVDGGWSVLRSRRTTDRDLRADRPRRHRPGRPRHHLRPRAPRHRRRAGRSSCSRLRPGRRRRDGRRAGAAQALGLRSVVDAMPCDAGRNVGKLAELSRRTRRPRGRPDRACTTTATTAPSHWSVTRHGRRAGRTVRRRYHGRHRRATTTAGRVVRRTAHRAGVIKVAGSDGGPSDRDARIFEAAAEAHRRTGSDPHPLRGRDRRARAGGLLGDDGVDPAHVALSHVDKVVDRGYHASCWRPVPSRSTTSRSAGATAQRHAPARSAGRSRTASSAGSSSGMDAARQGYYARVRRLARAGLAARRVLGRHASAARDRRRLPAAAVRRQPGAGVLLRATCDR